MSIGKQVRTKINSVKSTQKITNAMEKVAASKMRAAQKLMELSKPYAEKIRQVVGHVARSHSEYRHPYLIGRESIKRVGYIVVSSDRGLCGGLNSQLFRDVVLAMREWSRKSVKVDLCVMGKKADAFFGRMGANVVAKIDQLGDKPKVETLVKAVTVMLDSFDRGEIDAIYIAHNVFVNTMVQQPIISQLLPLPEVGIEQEVSTGHWDYLYEPNARGLLDKLLVRYIEMQVYQGVADNLACEQCARMMAMRSATDNAKDMIEELSRIYNKARQAAITQEIAEIVSGAEAV